MADRKVSALTELSVTPATGDLFHIVDISEAADADKNKRITWGTIDAAIDTIIAANNSGFLVAASDLSDVASAATARTNLGLAIGTDVQAYDAGLADIAGLAVTDGNIIVGDGANWVAENGATARTSLGLAIGTNVQAWDDDLDDIAALTPTKGNLMAGNGTDWVALGVGSNDQVLTADSAEASGIKWAASTGGLSNVVEDTTPQLGGNLDVNGNSIVSTSAGDITITPDTTGSIVLDGLSWPQSDGTANYVLETDGAGQLGWVAQSGGGGSDTLADIATNSTTTAHQTFALDAATSLIIEDSGGTDILTVDEATATTTVTGDLQSARGLGGSRFFAGGAGNATMTGDFNVGIGDSAIDAITSGQSNVAVGYIAGGKIENGSNNVAIGSNALRDLTSGSRNMAIGQGTMLATTSANDNVAIGDSALKLVTGSGNIGVGQSSLLSLASGTFNVAIGNNAAQHVVSGADNTAIGAGALYNNTSTTGDNVAIGREAMINSSTASGVVALGHHAGKNQTTSNVLHITNAETSTPLVYGDFSTGLLTFHTSDAGTTTVVNTVSLEHLSSGTPAAGFGAAYRIGLESTTTDDQDAVRLIGKWTTATHATRAAEGALTAYYTSTEETPIRWGADSSGETLGFYNTAPISQPSGTGETTGFTAGSGTAAKDDSTYTGNVGSTAYTTGDIVKHLKNLGLIAS